MSDTFFMIYAAAAAVVTCCLLFALVMGRMRARRRNGDDVLSAKYLHILMLSLMSDQEQVPRFPLMRRAGSRLLLAQTIAGVVAVTYGLDAAVFRRIISHYQLDKWLLHRAQSQRGYRRAQTLALLGRLPIDGVVAARLSGFLNSRNRYVRFFALEAQIAADPATALRLLSEYEYPLSPCEVSEIMALLRRGMLPVAYEPLVASPVENLRRVGVAIVRQFGIEDAEECLLHIAAQDPSHQLGLEAIYTLCSMHSPLNRREIAARVGMMNPSERKALLRYMAFEGYSSSVLGKLFDRREQPYYASLVQSYKRCLV